MSSTNEAQNRPPKKKGNKVFGLMSKRRWFGVSVFLLGMLYTYTIDQEFNDTTSRANYFIRDSTPYNFKSVKIEGDIIDYIFIRPFWQDTFIWQLGSYFNWTESPRYYYNDFVLFSDVISNKIYKFSEKYGMQVLFTNSGDLDDKTDTNILEPGSNGILVDPKDNDILYIAQHYNHRIVRKNINTPHKSDVIVDSFEGKRLNSPNDMIFGPNNEYIYFTDPPYGFANKKDGYTNLDHYSELKFNGIYRVNIKTKKLDKLGELERPNGIVFGSEKDILYVSNCIPGKFELNKYQLKTSKNNDVSLKLLDKYDDKWIYKNIKNNEISPLCSDTNDNDYIMDSGCVDGFTIHKKGYIITSCPCQKICVLNEKNGELLGVITMPANTKVSNLEIINDDHLFITGNFSIWKIQLQTNDNNSDL